MKVLFTFFFLLIVKIGMSQELTPDANTLLLLHFNNSVNGAAGEIPVSSSNISYDVGRFGQALKCNGNTLITFDTTGNLNRMMGTIEFWIKPENYTGAGYIFDMNYINGILIEIGYWTGITINNNPNVAFSIPLDAWFPDTWYHLAFTWGNGELKMYLNGKVIKKILYSIALSPIPLTQFSIGAPSFGSGGFKGLLDEFRISNIPRSESEICQDYMQGWGTIQTIEVSQSSITLYKGWNVYLNIPDSYQYPRIVARNGTDSTVVGAGCINWSVSDPSVLQVDNNTLTLKAIGGGTANLNGSIAGITFSIPVTVKLPFLPEERIQVIDSFLSTPAACNSRLVPVTVLIYLPTDDGINLNTTYGGTTFTDVEKLKKHCLNISKFAKFSLEEGSKFRGYNNLSSNSYLGYQVVEYIIVYEPPPLCFLKRPNVYQPDYNQIMARHNGKRLIDTLGVREIWIFGGDWQIAEGDESNMSSKTTGDISNSLRRNDDLPIYDNTYILYNYNFQRGGNESVHNHGHQIESMASYVARKQDGNDDMFWKNFVGRVNGNPPLGRCGDTHHPPNTTVDYDYCNSTLVASDIFDWKPLGGQTKLVNCQTWDTLHYSWPPITISGLGCCDAGELPDYNSRFFILWMQSIPGNGNQIPYGTKYMSNWWSIFSNWDSTTTKIGLYQNDPDAPAICGGAISTLLSSNSICLGNSFSINYTASNFNLNSGNIFTVQLSDVAGSFTSPVNIGTLTSIAANGSISVTIPINSTAGSNYLLRTNSSNPAITGTSSGLLTINSIPPTPTTTAGSATTFCTGGSVTLTSNAANGNQWYKDGIAISGSTGTTLNVTTSGSYTAKVTASGCESAASNAIVVTVSPIPPTPAISAGGTTIFCQGGSVTLTSNAASGNQWYKDGVAMGGATSTTLNVTTSGSYTTKVTVGGCESALSNAIVVTVNSAPSAPTVTAGSATTFCTGGSVTLTSNAANGNQWYKDGTAISGATSTTLNVTTSGSYTAKVTASGCESAVSNAIAVTVSSIPPTPTITAGGTTIFCQGGSVILTSNAANGNQWYKDGIAIGGATGTTLNVTTSGSYTTKVTVGGCESAVSNTIVVTVNPAPSAPTITAGSATTFCQGGSVLLTSNAASGNQWYKDGVAIGGATGTTLNVTASGSYTAKVTVSGCESAVSNVIAVTVSSIPSTPTISAGGSTTFCQGGNVTLTSNAASGNQWYKDGVAISGATGTTLNVTTSGSYTTKITVGGCESAISNTIVVTVNPSPPTPTITAGSATTFCTGGSVTLTSNAANGNQWFKDGIAISGATSTTLNVTTSGSYTAKVTASGCASAASNAIVVTVNTIPSTPTITAGSTTIFCQGGLVILTSNAATGNQWYKDGVAIGGATSTTLNVTTSGSYAAKITASGCESAISNGIVVTVNPAPSTPTVTAGSATTFCQGGSVTLTSNAANGNQWFKDGIAISGATSTTLNVTTSGSYTSKVTASGCESAASNAIVVTVSPIPSTATITAGGTTTFCQGGSVILTSNAASGNQWYKDGVAIGGATSTSLNVTTSGSYTTKVTVSGCESAISNTIVVTVNPAPSAPAVTAGSATTFCTGGSVTLTSTAANGNQWYKDGVAIGGATGTTLNITASGSYTAKVTSNGCTSNPSNAISVTVNAIPATPTITQNGNQLTSSAVSGNQWYLNNNLIAGAVGQTYNPTASGNYTVQVTLSNCSSVFSSAFDFIMNQGSEIKVFPNPVSDQLVVTQTGIPITLNIRIVDITGKELINMDNSSSRIEINMSKYAAGIYIIEIENKDRDIKEKKLFVKM